MFKIAILFTAFAAYAGAQTADYCATTLCAAGRTHIACNDDAAPDPRLVNLSSLRTHILNRHNQIRNNIAGGSVSPFRPAVRMATMRWNNELAKLAALNVKQFKLEHDQCRNTDTFKYSGQNLAWYWSIPAVTPLEAINNAIDNWYAEKATATRADINRYTSKTPTIGHFTVMVNDRNTHVGCAVVRRSKNGGTEYYVGCNYAQTNVRNRKTYQPGPAASGCATGKNPTYPNLCSVTEPIDANTILA